MKKHGDFAKEEVVEDYLSALLDEPAKEDLVQRQAVEKLLKKADAEPMQKVAAPVVEETQEEVRVQTLEQLDIVKEQTSEIQPSGDVPNNIVADKQVRDEPFQALYFDVAGLTLAVPLTELGGIHQLDKIGPLFGKPSWYKGVMLYREEKYSVVDTARWIMPEKFNEKLEESLNYQYLIMLDNSSWGLACESLINTITLNPDDVKWRDANNKRPWLAGMVKEKMCALIDVEALIAMLNQGLDSNQE